MEQSSTGIAGGWRTLLRAALLAVVVLAGIAFGANQLFAQFGLRERSQIGQ